MICLHNSMSFLSIILYLISFLLFSLSLIVFSSCTKHVLVKNDHSNYDTYIEESKEVSLILRNIKVTSKVVIEDKCFCNSSQRIKHKEAVISKESCYLTIFEEIVKVSISISNWPYDYDSCEVNSICFGLHHIPSDKISS